MKIVLIAKNQHGSLVYAWQANKEQLYWCPECGQAVNLRAGQHKEAYFAHQRRSDCLNEVGETDQHLLGKRQMWQWANQCGWQPRVEVYLPNIQQRPDLLLTLHQQQIAMEFQCSSLSCERLIERNEGYRELDIGYVWYLGPGYRHHLSTAKRAQFVQEYQGKPALFWWNLDSHCPIYQQLHLTCAATRGQLIKQFYQLHSYPRSNFRLRSRAYQAGHLLNLCPLIAHCHPQNNYLMRQSDFEWRLQLLLWLERIPRHYEWASEQWWRVLYCQTVWSQCPCLTRSYLENLRRQQLRQFTQELIRAQIIGKYPGGFYLRQKPRWFNDESSKVAAISGIEN